MKVVAIATSLLVACSSAAAVANPNPAEPFNDGLTTRDADAAPLPGWWGFTWSKHGMSGWKRNAEADAAPIPGWWGFKWSKHGMSGWKRDATPEPVPGWWGFKWSQHGMSGWKRDAPTNTEHPGEDADFIYLPNGMTPEDLALMIKDSQAEQQAGAKTTTTA